MNFKEATDFITAHRGPLAIGATAFGVITYQFVRDVVWPEVRPARPVVHSQRTLDAMKQAEVSWKRAGLSEPK